MVIDNLVRQLQAGAHRDRFKAHIWETRCNVERVVLVKPQTYMNLSGISVQQVKNWYKLANEEMLVIYDDVDLDYGTLRLRTEGSAGGHNGLSSVIQSLGSNQIPRLRIGIGRSRGATTAHVLSGFSSDEESQLAEIVQRAASAAMLWMKDGPIVAMNQVNQRPQSRQPRQPGSPEELTANTSSVPAQQQEST
jgi:PTH1 family peptidyl-tRNA hydrolase